MATPTTKRYRLLALIGVSTPLAFAFETAIRRLIMPPDFDDVRAWLQPEVTPYAWAMVPATVMATGLGFLLKRWLLRRALARPSKPGVDPERARERAEFDALMLSTSAPQVPALVATMTFMLGAELTPVLIAMGVATVGVLSLGLSVKARG